MEFEFSKLGHLRILSVKTNPFYHFRFEVGVNILGWKAFIDFKLSNNKNLFETGIMLKIEK